MTLWAIMSRDDAIGGYYANTQKGIKSSSSNSSPYTAAMYRRQGALEDPWISIQDHGPAISAGTIVYGENNFGGAHASAVQKGGADVYIRNKAATYNIDNRSQIDNYKVTKDYNFINGGNYAQVVVANIGTELSYADAMTKAAQLAKDRNAYGFFYQMHNNGHQIVGFYQNEADMKTKGDWVQHGHARGAIATTGDL